MSDHTPNMIGVDISKAHLDAHALPSGRAARFANNAAGIRKLAAWAGPAHHLRAGHRTAAVPAADNA